MGTSTAHRKLIAKAHIAKKELGLDNDTYQAVLQRLTGATSSRDLTDGQLEKVLSEFRRLGWIPKSATGKQPSANRQVRLIWALWNDLGKLGIVEQPTRPNLRAFIIKNTGVATPEWLNPKQASNAITGLKEWKKRELQKRNSGTRGGRVKPSSGPPSDTELKGVAQ